MSWGGVGEVKDGEVVDRVREMVMEGVVGTVGAGAVEEDGSMIAQVSWIQ